MQAPFFRPPLAPWQFFEQQSDGYAQASFSVAHVWPVPPGGGATHLWVVPSHEPEQHRSFAGEQGSPTWRQGVEEQVAPALPAFGQSRVQHWALEPQASPSYAHESATGAQVPPPVHFFEQHCRSPLHDAASSRQEVGGVSHAFDALQYPVQQLAFFSAAVAPTQPSRRRWHPPPPPLVHTFAPMAPSQDPEQQSWGYWQESPGWPRVQGPMLHTCDAGSHEALQQSDAAPQPAAGPAQGFAMHIPAALPVAT